MSRKGPVAPTRVVQTIDLDHAECGRLVREGRLRRKMPLRCLADHLGLSVSHTSRLERGVRQWTAAMFQKAIELVE